MAGLIESIQDGIFMQNKFEQLKMVFVQRNSLNASKAKIILLKIIKLNHTRSFGRSKIIAYFTAI